MTVLARNFMILILALWHTSFPNYTAASYFSTITDPTSPKTPKFSHLSSRRQVHPASLTPPFDRDTPSSQGLTPSTLAATPSPAHADIPEQDSFWWLRRRDSIVHSPIGDLVHGDRADSPDDIDEEIIGQDQAVCDFLSEDSMNKFDYEVLPFPDLDSCKLQFKMYNNIDYDLMEEYSDNIFLASDLSTGHECLIKIITSTVPEDAIHAALEEIKWYKKLGWLHELLIDRMHIYVVLKDRIDYSEEEEDGGELKEDDEDEDPASPGKEVDKERDYLSFEVLQQFQKHHLFGKIAMDLFHPINFQFGEQLGYGASGEVFKVKDLTEDKMYAVKRIYRKLNDSTLRDVINEIMVSVKLAKIEGLCKIEKVLFGKKHLYLMMPLFDEKNLHTVVNEMGFEIKNLAKERTKLSKQIKDEEDLSMRKALKQSRKELDEELRKVQENNYDELLDYFYQAVKVLAAMEKEDYFHYDIKLENFVLRRAERILGLADLGWVVKGPNKDSNLSIASHLTPPEMDFGEFAGGTATWKPKSTVYVLGKVFDGAFISCVYPKVDEMNDKNIALRVCLDEMLEDNPKERSTFRRILRKGIFKKFRTPEETLDDLNCEGEDEIDSESESESEDEFFD